MTKSIENRPIIRKSADQALVHRVATHLGEEWLDVTTALAAHYGDGPYGQPDPRTLAAYKSLGDFTAQGGSGPKKK